MLASFAETVRLSLHVIGATVWLGGQLTLAALVPVLRRRDPELPKLAARRFNLVAWPAFWLLVVTGIWNVAALSPIESGTYRTVLVAKILVVAASGATAWLHAHATSKAGLAVFGTLTGLTALLAVVLGVVLSG